MFNILKSTAKKLIVPIFKSAHNAYTAIIGNRHKPQQQQQQKSRNQNDFFGKYWDEAMKKTNLSNAPMGEQTALKILNIEAGSAAEVEPKVILQRYFTLLEKNDPANGGTIYLQSKVISAKEFLMEGIPDGEKLEQELAEIRKKQKEQEAADKEKVEGEKQEGDKKDK